MEPQKHHVQLSLAELIPFSFSNSSWDGNGLILFTLDWLTCPLFSFLVDNIPIREFKNRESIGVPFPKSQPMRIYSSLWNADDWATRGGLVKINWSKAPFTASYRNFNAAACVWFPGSSSCASKFAGPVSNTAWQNQELDAKSLRKLRWVQKNYMIYNYCTDTKRFPGGIPPECRH